VLPPIAAAAHDALIMAEKAAVKKMAAISVWMPAMSVAPAAALYHATPKMSCGAMTGERKDEPGRTCG
jgi:hypothetical protein